MKVLGCAALMLFATTGSKSPAIARWLLRRREWRWRLGVSSQTLTVGRLVTARGVSTTGNYEIHGALLGATLGYNYQTGPGS